MNTPVTTERVTTDSIDAQVLCLATNWGAEDDLPCSTIPFLNRPFLHHVVERLADRGFQTIRFVCEQGLEDYAQLLGSGERWGLSFQFARSGPNGFVERNDAEPVQSRLKPEFLSLASHSLPLSTKNEPNSRMIRVDSPSEFIESQIAVMKNEMQQHVTIERNLGGHVWVGRNVKIHRSAQIRGPVLIGDNTRIGPGVHLDTCSVIGPDCVIGRNSTICKSTVMANLYVGESLEVRNSIVFADKIVNVHFNTTIRVKDRLLVSRI